MCGEERVPPPPRQTLPTVRIDSYAHGNRWRQIHPGNKGLLVLCSLTASLLSRNPGTPLLIALTMAGLTLVGAQIPWRGYIRVLAAPFFFLLWSCLLLLVTLSPNSLNSLHLPGIDLSIGIDRSQSPLALLVFARSLGALCSLLFLALTTPLGEIAGALRHIGVPRLLVELIVIAYRQIFILLETFAQMRSAQEARLGYSSLRRSWRSAGELAGNILIKTITRARRNHQALLARGYDSELRFLSPRRPFALSHLLCAGSLGSLFLLLAWRVQP